LLSFVNQWSEKGKKELRWNTIKTLNFDMWAQHLHLSPRDPGWNRTRQPSLLVVHLFPGIGGQRKICPLPELRHANLLFATQRSFCKDQPWKGMGRTKEFGRLLPCVSSLPY
jgi:hypothetical protein